MTEIQTATPLELERLRNTDAEYRITVKVLAVLVERLLALVGGERVEITDQALADSPDLMAWRDEAARRMVVTVAR